MNALYADGGVIGPNPSKTGGTWAYRILAGGVVVAEKSGVITPKQAKVEAVTNNHTELCAVVAGLRALPGDWAGVIYSDSMITLGRVFEGWKWENVPAWLKNMYEQERARLTRWNEITYVQLDGHPTAAQLAAGVGKRGHPVSEHNVWCDHACGAAGRAFLKGAHT